MPEADQDFRPAHLEPVQDGGIGVRQAACAATGTCDVIILDAHAPFAGAASVGRRTVSALEQLVAGGICRPV